MIKVNKLDCPVELTSELQKDLTEVYKITKESVWQKKFIKEALLASSYQKCVYCECKLEIESNYLEVEHYYPKIKYPENVVDWDNLLPICKRCNVNKGDFDTYLNPFINPALDNPKEHIMLDLYRLRPVTIAGENTIEEINLNDSSKVVLARQQISDAVLNLLEDVYQKILEYNENPLNRRLNRIANSCKGIFQEGLSDEDYAGTVSTVLTNSPLFEIIISFLKEHNRWDTEFLDIVNELNINALSTNKTLFLNYYKEKLTAN